MREREELKYCSRVLSRLMLLRPDAAFTACSAFRTFVSKATRFVFCSREAILISCCFTCVRFRADTGLCLYLPMKLAGHNAKPKRPLNDRPSMSIRQADPTRT